MHMPSSTKTIRICFLFVLICGVYQWMYILINHGQNVPKTIAEEQFPIVTELSPVSIRTAQSYDNSSHTKQPLFLFGAGFGTTATRTIQKAMTRHLGLNAVHWNNRVCLPNQNYNYTHADLALEDIGGIVNNQLRHTMMTAIDAHVLVVDAFKLFRERCLEKKDSCSWEEAQEYIYAILDKIRKVIQHPWIDAINDIPYTSFPSFIRRVIKEEKLQRGNSNTVSYLTSKEAPTTFGVVLTQRNSTQWMESRLKNHGLKDLFCYLPPQSKSDNSATSYQNYWYFTNRSRTSPPRTSMDMYECFQLALRVVSEGKQAPPTVATDVFSFFANFRQQYGKVRAKKMVIEAKDHSEAQILAWTDDDLNRQTQPTPIFAINLFEANPRLTTADVADRIATAMALTSVSRNNSYIPALFGTPKQNFVRRMHTTNRRQMEKRCFRPLTNHPDKNRISTNLTVSSAVGGLT